jgi:hypothetical protein
MRPIITKKERRETMKTLVLDVEGLGAREIEILRNLVSALKKQKISEEEADRRFLSAAGRWKGKVNAEELIKNIYKDRLVLPRKEPKL